jgi:signal transduction histidine kinase/ligand-binding sensor domain-containing protein
VTHPRKQRGTFIKKLPTLNILRALCLLLLSSSSSLLLALDPNRQISQYAHTAWRLQEGVFNGAPTAITQTADGYLWIGTQAGLVRFDGVRFLPWSSLNGKHLPSTTITSLLGARDGSLWIGMEGGLSRWDNRSLTDYRTKQERINSIIEDRDGTVWFTRSRANDVDGPLCRVLKNGTWCYGADDGIPSITGAGALIEDTQSRLWITGDAEVIRWKLGSSHIFTRNGLKQGIGQVNDLAPSPDGAVWVGIGLRGRDKGLQQIVQDAWKPFATPELDGGSLEVQSLLLDRENVLWIGTVKQGIYRIRGRKVDHFNSADGLSSDSVYKFYEDREGNLWTVTAKGIDCFRDLPVVSFSTREGLSVDEVDSVLATRDGTIWIGTSSGLNKLRQNSISPFGAQRPQSGQITSLLEDHSNRLWIGKDNTLSIYDRGMVRRLNRLDGSPIGVVVGMTETVDHIVWIETIGPPRTLISVQDLKVREVLPVPKMPAARKVAADPQGGIWLGLMNGNLARYSHGEIQLYRFSFAATSRVDQLLVNSDGSVLGATAAGLIGWKEGRRQTLGVRNGLPCAGVFAFVFDNQRNLWLYTQCGLVEVQSVDLQKWWGNPDVKIRVKILDALDGVQPGIAPFNGAAKSPDGRLWFANGLVLQMIDPRHLGGNQTLPPVHVEKLVADRKNYLPLKDLRLPALMRDLQIDYTALSFKSPQKVRFRYKLEGRDSDWFDAGTRRQAFYTDLHPGKYRFRVIACNNDGVWNEEGAMVDFAIAPAWYQTWWFLLFCVVTGLLFVWFLHRLRLRQVAKVISARFDERLAERTRMARDLHDTFLQTVQGSKLVADHALERVDDPFRTRQALGQLSEWLGRAVQEGRSALNSLRASTTQSNDLADALRRAMEESRLYAPIEMSFSVVGDAKEMHPVVRDEIYRLGYEAIRNAYKHSKGNRLDVELKYGQDLAICVHDNGVGFDLDAAERGKEEHFGLQGMRERVARIGGELTLVSSAKSGTSITVIVPGNLAFREPPLTAFEKLTAILKRKRPTDLN